MAFAPISFRRDSRDAVALNALTDAVAYASKALVCAWTILIRASLEKVSTVPNARFATSFTHAQGSLLDIVERVKQWKV